MGYIKFVLYVVLSGAPTVICANFIGVSTTLAIVFVILVHELGHAVVWHMAGIKTLILVTPLFGICIPRDYDSDLFPFTAYGTTLMYLGGPIANILLLLPIALLSRLHPSLGETDILTHLSLVSGIVLLYNLLIPCPFLDGWRVLFYALAGPAIWNRILLWGLSLGSIWIMWSVDPFLAGGIGVLLFLVGCPVADTTSYEVNCGFFSFRERATMVAAWIVCVASAIGAICMHPEGLYILTIYLRYLFHIAI